MRPSHFSPVRLPFRLRSFVRRNSRQTIAQAHARHTLWPTLGLNVEHGVLQNSVVFNRTAPLFLEIGFGTGQSLLALAIAHPDKNFIGIDTHQPGVGALMLGISSHGLTNLRIYQEDAIDVIEQCLPQAALDGVLLFFPDPWPKRRHHARRFIQQNVVNQLVDKLKVGGVFHLATDWEDYARHIMKILSATKHLLNTAGNTHFATRSPYRPIITKFEHRALQQSRSIWELQFHKIS
jgi:tRNA (guanine-N7-)-methyltransferase